MTQELATNESFQEKMFKRIRDSMGDLMSNEDLKKVVESALQKAFFEERIDTSGYHEKKIPALFIELIKEHLGAQVKVVCEEYIKNNPDKINAAIQDSVGKGFLNLMTTWLDTKLNGAFYEFQNNLRSQGLIR